MALHALCRLTVAAALIAGVVVIAPPPAQAAYVEATLVATRSTSTWDIPSTDPSGITYDPVHGRLVISDGEVEETPLYRGTNIFFSTLTGEQSPDGPGWTTLPWSDEPTGITYQNAGRLFVSDDDADKIFLVDPGADGIWTTADPAPEEFSVRPQQGDPEDVTVDMDTTNNGHLLVLDGDGASVWEYGPGANGVFDGVPGAGGDDTATSYDISQYGALDPEGLEYHPGRNTILVVDAGSETIYELDRQGALLNRIGIGAASPRKAAGMTLAPASDGSGALNLYVVDRGVDNDFDPTQNDGRFYELALNFPPLGGVVNTGPTVDAGPDIAVQMPASAALQGTVTDDGLPNPPAAVTTTWSKASGTGTVEFGDPAATSTTASFSAPGTYVLRLTATDGEIQRSDDVTVQVSGTDGLQVVDVPVRAGEDDAEERSSRTILDGNDLEMVDDVKSTNTSRQTVGLRFAGVPVPQGATVTNAYVQFTAAEVNTDIAGLTIAGEAADDAAPFTTAAQSVSGRVQTAAVAWEPEPWAVRRARGVENQTPDLSAVVQAIVDRSGWSSGNALALVVTGSGTRNAESYESSIALNAPVQPVLHLEFRPAGETTQNTAPLVDAGPDSSVEQPDAAVLAGSVTDDGLPGGAVTTAWSVVSGPGTATFADPAAASTTATFSAPGTYVLRLTGSDGELSSADDLTVEVTEAVAPPPSGVVEVPVQSSVDDAEERSATGAVNVSSRDLELGLDGSRAQTVGLRFAGVDLPEGATVTNAYIQFQVDEASSGAADLVIAGQAADDAGSFTTGTGNVSSREQTRATVSWAPAGWSSANLRGPDQQTPNLASVVQEIVDRDGWVSGNALAFVVTGSGNRTAEAADSGTTRAPVLRIEYGGDPADGGTGGDPGDGGGDGGDGGTVTTLSLPILATVDDAEERANGGVRISSGDLNMAEDDSRVQTVGMRFAGVSLPAGATIVSAYVQFQADEVDSGPADLVIAGQAADDVLSFSTATANVSSRPRTDASVAWTPGAWTTVGLRGTAQQTPDLAAVVQEIVDRPGWASGNALALLVTGSGERAAESYDGGAKKAPVLHIQYIQ